MFTPSANPRLFACPPGADFPQDLVTGLRGRMAGQPPDAMARVELFVNTQRMKRRVSELFNAGGAVLLPRISVITDLAHWPMDGIAPAASPLGRRLELRQLVAGLVRARPDFAPRAAVADLAESLAALIEEMDGEGVSPDALRALETADHSEHWKRTLAFLDIATRFTAASGAQAPGPAGRFRLVAERLARTWAESPPVHPVLIAGSTGSRGTTALLMRAAARLPQGALIVPGFDFDLPAPVWAAMEDARRFEDHPQYRYATLMRALGLGPDDVQLWHSAITPRQAARNRLVSLALRPAPVTSQWRDEAPKLADSLPLATGEVTLIEAETPRQEALAIALALREAAELGRKAALITTDHGLTRRVAAAMDRWRIEPDASMGLPLTMSPAGVFMRMILRLTGGARAAEDVLALLKHPITASGAERGAHLARSRELELWVRRKRLPELGPPELAEFAGKQDASDWAGWLSTALFTGGGTAMRPLADHVAAHIRVAEALARGGNDGTTRGLWAQQTGRELWGFLAELRAEAGHGGQMSPADYTDLFETFAKGREARDPVTPHPDIMVWGTLEARVQGADLVILGGLNDGVWPHVPGADPWLNRDLRAQAGMLLPERNVGLAAHDFQQAVAARRVILTRAKRDAEAETVPSRWLNRMINLLQGMTGGGAAALADMRERGAQLLALAAQMESPAAAVAPEPRPAPNPPADARPSRLSVTDITSLIRDPYAIYARHVLRLKRLEPLRARPDPRLRGEILHAVAHRFVSQSDFSALPDDLTAALLSLSSATFHDACPWPEAALHWQARFARIAAAFVRQEVRRQAGIAATCGEKTGELVLPEIAFTLRGRADRIDLMAGSGAVIYDYKTGTPPTKKQAVAFEKQLYLEALILAEGGFAPPGKRDPAGLAYLGLGSAAQDVPLDIDAATVPDIRAALVRLITAYRTEGQGYAARRHVATTRFEGDYDHLARLGEWDETDAPLRIDLT